MDDGVRTALERDRVVDITTTGRQSGAPHRIEIWIHHLDGTHFITGTPGRRGWYANVLEHPEFVLHLKGSAQADLPARARPVTGEDERRTVFSAILPAIGRDADIDAWVARSPLIEVLL